MSFIDRDNIRWKNTFSPPSLFYKTSKHAISSFHMTILLYLTLKIESANTAAFQSKESSRKCSYRCMCYMVLQVRWCTQSWSMSRLNVTEYTSTFFLSNSLTSSSPFLFLVCYLIYTYIIIVVYCGSNVLQTPQKPFNGCIPAADKIYRKYSFNECIYIKYISIHYNVTHQ